MASDCIILFNILGIRGLVFFGECRLTVVKGI